MTHEPIAKQIGLIIPPVSATLALNEGSGVLLAAVLGGLIFGGMWRAGSMVSEGRAWTSIRRDAAISILIGGANAILTLAVVKVMGFGVLLGMATAVVIGATGVRALPEIKAALVGYAQRKLIGDGVAMMQPRAPDLEQLARDVDDAIERKDER